MRALITPAMGALLLCLTGCVHRTVSPVVPGSAPPGPSSPSADSAVPPDSAATDAPPDSLTEKGLKTSNLTPRDADPVYAPLRYAIVVGVNAPADKSLHALRYAEHDADEMATALRSSEVGGFDRVVTLPKATRGQLLAAIDDARRVLRPQDLFLLYFSGHGTASIDERLRSSLFLMTSDTVLARLETSGVGVRDLQDRLEEMRPRRKVLIVDACYNGDGKSGLSEQTRDRQRLTKGIGDGDLKEPLRESEAHLFAAAVGQPALEDTTIGGGVYTHFLLRALRQDPAADANHDGAISVSEAHSYARDQTMARTGFRQVPWANYRIVGREDIYLAGRQRAGAEQALVYTFSERYGGARMYINGQEKGVLPRAVAMDPGTYQLTLKAPDGTVFFDRAVSLRAANSVRIDDLDLAVTLSHKSARTIEWTGAGITAGLGVTAALLGMQTLTYKTYYDTGHFTSEAQANEVKTRGELYRLGTNVAIGSAIVAGLTTGYLYFRAPKMVLRRFGVVDGKIAPVVVPGSASVSLSVGF